MLLDVPKVGDRRRWGLRCFSESVAVWEVQAVGVPDIDPNECISATERSAPLPSSYIVRNKLFVRSLSARAAPTGIVMTDCPFAAQSLAGGTVAYPALGELEDTTEGVAGQVRLGRSPTSTTSSSTHHGLVQ
jgi:hypothetical protein